MVIRLSEMESNLTREMNHTLMQKLTNLQSKLSRLQEERETKMEALTARYDRKGGASLFHLLPHSLTTRIYVECDC